MTIYERIRQLRIDNNMSQDDLARAMGYKDRSMITKIESGKVEPHIFRHTAASLALQRGMPLEQVQRFLGHSRIQTTLRYAKTLQQDVHISHSHFVA